MGMGATFQVPGFTFQVHRTAAATIAVAATWNMKLET
jgi:hypothetical protein